MLLVRGGVSLQDFLVLHDGLLNFLFETCCLELFLQVGLNCLLILALLSLSLTRVFGCGLPVA